MQRIPVGKNYFMKVDDADVSLLNQHKWRITFTRHKLRNGTVTTYLCARATNRIDGKYISAHRFLMNPPKGLVVDHINGDRLDNRRKNLRVCTIAQNIQNQGGHRDRKYSKYRGVSKLKNKWLAQIIFSREHLHLGFFETEESAARAYNKAARKHFGQYARLNRIKQPQTTDNLTQAREAIK